MPSNQPTSQRNLDGYGAPTIEWARVRHPPLRSRRRRHRRASHGHLEHADRHPGAGGSCTYGRCDAADGSAATLTSYGCAVTEEDRIHWDDRHARVGPAPIGATSPPPLFAPYEHLFPTAGRALEVACGPGRGALWLASLGLDVWGLDISAVAIGLARDLARRSGVGGSCRFDVVDLDQGLPEGPPVDVILCHMFRDPRLDRAIIQRLAPGGLLAMTALSEVDAGPGPFRVLSGELPAAFAELHVMVAGERQGEAWLLAKA